MRHLPQAFSTVGSHFLHVHIHCDFALEAWRHHALSASARRVRLGASRVGGEKANVESGQTGPVTLPTRPRKAGAFEESPLAQSGINTAQAWGWLSQREEKMEGPYLPPPNPSLLLQGCGQIVQNDGSRTQKRAVSPPVPPTLSTPMVKRLRLLKCHLGGQGTGQPPRCSEVLGVTPLCNVYIVEGPIHDVCEPQRQIFHAICQLRKFDFGLLGNSTRKHPEGRGCFGQAAEAQTLQDKFLGLTFSERR
ncbi:hypothetical protein GN956_G18281 [Arapaima gigas]